MPPLSAPSDWWECELLDRMERSKGLLGEISGDGSLSWSISRQVGGQGTIRLTRQDQPIDWLSDRIRLTYVSRRDGDTVRLPHGVWLPAVTGRNRQGPVTHLPITLLDKTEILNTQIGVWLTYPKNTIVLDKVTAIIRDRGETKIQATPSTGKLRVPLTWEPTDTWLKVTNDLLDSIGYSAVRADMRGWFLLAPWIAPADRPVAGRYSGLPADLDLLPEWTDEAALYDIPTGVRIVIEGTNDQAGFIGAADLPAGHPLSAASRGGDGPPVVRLLVEQGEADTVATANLLAKRRLAEATEVTRRVTYQHPPDRTDLTSAVELGELGMRGVVIDRTVKLSIGANTSSTARRIYTGGEDLEWLTTNV